MSPRPLSPRQRIIATLVAAGLSDKQIAGRLGVGADVVGYHVGRIAKAWGLDSQLNIRIQITHRVIQNAA
jgi:DNA-binding NarL/FixJ family response regulator